MLQVLYKSVSTVPLSNAELSRLLMTARVRNDLTDLTGILVFHENTFLQLIEGPEETVLETYERIAGDPRHKCLQVLLHEEITERSFPNWSMGFVCSYGNWLNQTPGIDELFHRKGTFPKDAGKNARRLLEEFRYTPWRRKVDLGYAPLIAR